MLSLSRPLVRLLPLYAVALLACGGSTSGEHIDRDGVIGGAADAAVGGSAGAVAQGGGAGGTDGGGTTAAGAMAGAFWAAGSGGALSRPDAADGGSSDPCTSAVTGGACRDEGVTCDGPCGSSITCQLGTWQRVVSSVPC